MTNVLTPKQLAIRDMRAEGLDVTLITMRKVTVTEVEEFVQIQDGRILNGGKRIKRTTVTQTIVK